MLIWTGVIIIMDVLVAARAATIYLPLTFSILASAYLFRSTRQLYFWHSNPSNDITLTANCGSPNSVNIQIDRITIQ